MTSEPTATAPSSSLQTPSATGPLPMNITIQKEVQTRTVNWASSPPRRTTILTPRPPPGTWTPTTSSSISSPSSSRIGALCAPEPPPGECTPDRGRADITPAPPPGTWTPTAPSSSTASLDLIKDTADLLYAAAPAAWRGTSDLPQLPWSCPCRGLVLVVDFWAGLEGLGVCSSCTWTPLHHLGGRGGPGAAAGKGQVLPKRRGH